MRGDGLARAVDICCANLKMQSINDLVLGKVGSTASLHLTRDEAVFSDLRHATIPATHPTMTGSPPPPPAFDTCGIYFAHLALSAKAPTTIPQPKTDTEIEHTSTTNQQTAGKSPKPCHHSTREIQTDIYLQTPTGEYVPGHEIQWELMFCGDTSGLMEIVPGHHHFWANTIATTLCTLVKTDLRSQFYKTPPTRESIPTLQPLWSLGKEKVIKSKKRFASCLQALEARECAMNVATGPLVTTSSSTLSQTQGRPTTDDDIHQEASAQKPINEEIAVPLKDNNLFYKNGNPKPPSTGRLLMRGLTTKERKRPGGRKKDRRRDQRRGSPAEVLKVLHPEIAERTNEVDDPIQTLNSARDRMLLSLFMKYAVGIKHRETHTGLIHKTNHFGDASSKPPTQHMAMLPREHPVDLGASCFEPNTGLLLQDPLNHDTYVPGKTLSRSIGSLKHGDEVLAERHGPDGRGNFFLAKITCVMLFEIPQDKYPDANKIIQENTLSTGLGFTLTEHHHIRKHGWIHQTALGRWQLTNQVGSLEWKVVADLDRNPSRSRNLHKTPVTRVSSLVPDPPGNVVILTLSNVLCISASLGYHMRYDKSAEDSSALEGGMPVYTRRDATQVQGLPEFSRGIIQWGQGAVTRTIDGHLAFDRNKAIRRGRNLCHDQPTETLINIVETLPTMEENLRLLQGRKQVSRGCKHHINSYTGPDNHWQRNLRTEIRDLWQSLYRRTVFIVKNNRNDLYLLEPRAEIVALTTDLCTALETFSFSRALVGRVALIISTLTLPIDHFKETLGPNVLMTANSFTHERNELQSHLAAGLLRHGLAPTSWRSSRTGPWDIPSGAPEEKHFDILPRLQEYPDPVHARTEAQRREHDILPILQNPALARTEAQRRGLDILQILQGLLDIGNPTENAPENLPLSAHEMWDLQQHHRSLISHLYVLLPILFLTRQQEPY